MTRSNFMEKVLELLAAQAADTATLLDIFTSGYGGSYRKMRRIMRSGELRSNTTRAAVQKSEQQFYSLLNKLKREGLILKTSTSKSSFWKTTKVGLEKLKLLKKQEVLPAKNPGYNTKEDSKLKIIAFDVPEKERRKRKWLRDALLAMDFTLLQNSVWIGKNAIPEIFLKDLRSKRMLNYVHIFEISKTGTVTKFS